MLSRLLLSLFFAFTHTGCLRFAIYKQLYSESLVMVGAFLLYHVVLDINASALLKYFLQICLIVLDCKFAHFNIAHSVCENDQHYPFDFLEASIKIYRAHDGFQRICENRLSTAATVLFFTSAKP